MQDFTRTNWRMHVTLAGCAGPAAYGDPFQFLVEAITDLKHDFEFVVSNDPSVLLDALDPSSVMMVAERLPLRTPMLDVLRARGLRVVDLTAGDWLESWQTNTGSLSSRFVVGRWAARKLCGVLDSQERPQQHANIAGTRAGTIGSTVSDVIARLEKEFRPLERDGGPLSSSIRIEKISSSSSDQTGRVWRRSLWSKLGRHSSSLLRNELRRPGTGRLRML